MLQNFTNLPREAHVRFNDLASGKHKKGIIGLSEMTIRRLIKAGKFPRPRRYAGTRMTFFVYGEVLDWLEQQAGGEQ
jgi:phage transcriptional regulator, alpA